MEGMADSHSELVHCALGALACSNSTSSPNSSSIVVAAASVSHRDPAAPSFNQLQQAAFKPHSSSQTLFQHQGQPLSYSSVFQQSGLVQDASCHQACSIPQSNSHSRSVSQPASFFQSLWQSPSFHPSASIHYPDGVFGTKDDGMLAAASPSSEPSYVAASPSEVSMSEHETSTGVSGHSIPPLPPLSPSPNNHQLSSKKSSSDLNQAPRGQTLRRGHRRSHSEVPLAISAAGKDCFFGCPLPFAQFESSLDDMPFHKLNRSSSNSRKDLQRAGSRMSMEVVGEREGEGVDDVFSTYINIDKIGSHHNTGLIDGRDRAVSSPFLKKRGISRAPLGAEYTRLLSPSSEKALSLQEFSDSDKEDSDKEEDSFMGDHNERFIEDCNQQGQTAKEEVYNAWHQRSASMDNFPHLMVEGDDAQHNSGNLHKNLVRHHHSLSIEGSLDTKLNFLNAEIDGIDVKKIMADDKLAEIALMDPKRAKRILANRQSAARSKERKVRYISELERKVQTLQTEATTLSAQLTLMQRDSTGLSNENNELKLRLQSMEQQAQLREALHEALREEVQRLKVSTGQISGQMLNRHFYNVLHQSSHSFTTGGTATPTTASGSIVYQQQHPSIVSSDEELA